MKKRLARFLDQLRLRKILVLLTSVSGFFIWAVSFEFDKFSGDVSNPVVLWLIDFLEGPFPIYALIFLVPANILFSFLIAATQKTLTDLEAENKELLERNERIGESITVFFDGVLYNLSRKLRFNASGSERVSLYVIQEKDKSFIACGRFSYNPNYREKGRTQFNNSEGCISKAYNQDWFFDNQLPEPNTENYILHCETHHSVPREILGQIRMKSRLYAAKRIIDPDARHLGVIVVESPCQDAFSESELKRVLTEEAMYLAKVISDLRGYIPEPSFAADRGL